MNLETLTLEEAKEILQHNLDSGKLSEEDLSISDQRKKKTLELAEYLHTLLCHKDHPEIEILMTSASACTFYVEDSLDTKWTRPAHQFWMNIAHSVLQRSSDIVVIKRAAMALDTINSDEDVRTIFNYLQENC